MKTRYKFRDTSTRLTCYKNNLDSALNAYFIARMFGSLLLIIGLGSHPLALLIVVSMVLAYLTADFEAVSSMFSDPDKFTKADRFRLF